MESKSFVYWLQGFFELAEPKVLDEQQVDLIKRHLHMVFIHEIDPSYPNKEELDKAHTGVTLPVKIDEIDWSKLVKDATSGKKKPPNNYLDGQGGMIRC